MFINFDELDMLDFFEEEPIFIGEEGEVKYLYSVRDVYQLSMTLVIDAYAKQIEIAVSHRYNTIFAGQFEEVFEIRKSNDDLIVNMKNGKRLIIKKNSCLGVIFENV